MFYDIEAQTKWQPFLEDIFKYIFLNAKFSILNRILLKFVPKDPINMSTYFGWWLGDVWQQAIISTNDDQYLCHLMASLSHIELP